MSVLVIKLSLKHTGKRKYGVLNTHLIVIWVFWCLPVQPGWVKNRKWWRVIAMWTHCKNHFWVWDKLWRTVLTILAFFSCEIVSAYSNIDCTHELKTTSVNWFCSKISLLANAYFPLSSLCRYVSFLLSLNFICLRIISFHLSVYPRCLILCQIRVVQCNFNIEMLVESTSVGRMKRWESAHLHINLSIQASLLCRMLSKTGSVTANDRHENPSFFKEGLKEYSPASSSAYSRISR